MPTKNNFQEAASLDTNPERLIELASSNNPRVRMAVAGNPNTPVEALRALANDSYDGVVNWVSGNPSTPPDVIDYLSHSESKVVRTCAGYNPSTPAPTLSRLARDPDRYVKAACARNASTPVDALEDIARTGGPYSRRLAKKTIADPGSSRYRQTVDLSKLGTTRAELEEGVGRIARAVRPKLGNAEHVEGVAEAYQERIHREARAQAVEGDAPATGRDRHIAQQHSRVQAVAAQKEVPIEQMDRDGLLKQVGSGSPDARRAALHELASRDIEAKAEQSVPSRELTRDDGGLSI